MVHSTEKTDYRCFLSDLAGFTGPGLRVPPLTQHDENGRREGDSNPR